MSVDGALSTARIVKLTTQGTDSRVTFTTSALHSVTFRYVLFVTSKQWPSPPTWPASARTIDGAPRKSVAPRRRKAAIMALLVVPLPVAHQEWRPAPGLGMPRAEVGAFLSSRHCRVPFTHVFIAFSSSMWSASF